MISPALESESNICTARQTINFLRSLQTLVQTSVLYILFLERVMHNLIPIHFQNSTKIDTCTLHTVLGAVTYLLRRLEFKNFLVISSNQFIMEIKFLILFALNKDCRNYRDIIFWQIKKSQKISDSLIHTVPMTSCINSCK